MTRTITVHTPGIERLEEIVDGLTPGQQVPSQRVLRPLLRLTTNIISATLQAMEADGLLTRGPNRTFVRTNQPFEGESYAHRVVEVTGSPFVWKMQLFKGRIPWRVFLFTDDARALNHYEKAKARKNGLRVVLSRAPLAGGFTEIAEAQQAWAPR